MKKLYLFENLNYYIGNNLTGGMQAKSVILTTDVVADKYPKIIVDENGISVDWIDGVIDSDLF